MDAEPLTQNSGQTPAGACIVGTAGLCGAVLAASALASVASDGWGLAQHEMTGREFALDTAFNFAAALIPASRAARLGSAGRHSAEGFAERSFSGGSVSLSHAFHFHPSRTSFRAGLNMYSAYHSLSGRWGF